MKLATYRIGEVSDKDSVLVERYRRNDYVGPAIWGFRIPEPMEGGDRAHYYDSLVDYTSHYVLIIIAGKRAFVEAKPIHDGTHSFTGFITN